MLLRTSRPSSRITNDLSTLTRCSLNALRSETSDWLDTSRMCGVGNVNRGRQWDSNRSVCCVTGAKGSREGADNPLRGRRSNQSSYIPAFDLSLAKTSNVPFSGRSQRLRSQGSRVKTRMGRLRELIFQLVAEHPTWRAPRIHGELVMLGFEVSERSVARWISLLMGLRPSCFRALERSRQ